MGFNTKNGLMTWIIWGHAHELGTLQLHGESKSVDFRIGILFWWLPSLFMINIIWVSLKMPLNPLVHHHLFHHVPSCSILIPIKSTIFVVSPLSPWHAPAGLNRRRRRQHRFSQTALLGDSHNWSFHGDLHNPWPEVPVIRCYKC